MNNTIYVKDFVNKYVSDKEITQNITICTYLPIKKKCEIADAVVKAAYMKTGGMVKVHTVLKEMLKERMIIENYTNIRFENNDMSEEYDLLISTGVMQLIYSALPEDVEEFDKVMEMYISDFYDNYISTFGAISNMVDRLGNIISNAVSPSLQEIVKHLRKNKDSNIKELANNIEKIIRK